MFLPIIDDNTAILFGIIEEVSVWRYPFSVRIYLLVLRICPTSSKLCGEQVYESLEWVYEACGGTVVYIRVKIGVRESTSGHHFGA